MSNHASTSTSRLRRAIARTAAFVMVGGSLATFGTVVAAPAQAADDPLQCSAESLVEKQLANGAAWRMCSRIHPLKGLVLEQVEYKPPTDREYSGYKRVLDSISIAQLNVPYDTGHVQYNDITSYGFGKQYLIEQNESTCKGEILDVPQSFTYRSELIERTMPAICAHEGDTGLMTHAQETQLGGGVLFADQGTALEVSSIAKISWYEYQQLVTFDDHGQIEVGLGATGDIAPGAPGSNFFTTDPKTGWPIGGPKTADGLDTYASSHWHNAIYKVDFGIDEGERQIVEQWDYTSPGNGTRAPIFHGAGTEKLRSFSSVPGEDHDELSWFRVKNPNSLNPDGHARSYEIVNQNYNNRSIPTFQPLVTFTNSKACHEYATDNLHAGCPGESILDWVAQDNTALTDPVAWVNVGFHHTDKDEDQSPMPIHWQKFQIVPRDFFAQKPTQTEARACINGAPGGSVNTATRPCNAVNTEVPTVTADAGTPVVGTTLTATEGTWNTARTTWNYQYLWFRDGEPIVNDGVAAVDSAYVLTEADLGASITVKVTASQTGYPSGTAESAPLLVAGPAGEPTPSPSVSPTEEPSTTPGASPTVDPTVDPTVAPTATPTPSVTPGATPTATTPPQTGTVPSTLKAKVLKKGKVKVGSRPRVKVTVGAAGAVPEGTVQVRLKGKVVGTATVRDGVATVRLAKLGKAGTLTLKAFYTGSETVGATSAKVTLKVKKAKRR